MIEPFVHLPTPLVAPASTVVTVIDGLVAEARRRGRADAVIEPARALISDGAAATDLGRRARRRSACFTCRRQFDALLGAVA
jgi:hypothetical protein